MTFREWYEDADMPTRAEDGQWYDLETGIPYEPTSATPKKAKTSLSRKALDARAVAKFFGGKALSGSQRQKEWAEKIRKNVLENVTEEQATLLCSLTFCTTAKWWIENRELEPKEMGKRITRAAKILPIYKNKWDMLTQKEREQLSEEYNSLFK